MYQRLQEPTFAIKSHKTCRVQYGLIKCVPDNGKKGATYKELRYTPTHRTISGGDSINLSYIMHHKDLRRPWQQSGSQEPGWEMGYLCLDYANAVFGYC